MKERRVRFTATAQRHIQREKSWWFENRTHTEILAAEIEEVLRILALLPGAGTPYTESRLVDLRRLFLRRIDCHLYYAFDEHEAVLHPLWGARRRRGARIEL